MTSKRREGRTVRFEVKYISVRHHLCKGGGGGGGQGGAASNTEHDALENDACLQLLQAALARTATTPKVL